MSKCRFGIEGCPCDNPAASWANPIGYDERRERHPLSQRLHDLLKEIGDLHDKKQKDYGTNVDPFANVRGSVEFGVNPWVGAMVRLNDKVKRLQAHAKGSPLSNEGALDSFKDIAVYALIAHVLYEENEP